MNIHSVDVAIIVGYLVLVVTAGILISRRASKNLDSYFLGGKTIPWYILGVSNASGMFDITGTMWMVFLLFVYGLKSVWIPWLWPSFNQVFLMIYLSIWLRRSNVLTGAEWIGTRFGRGGGGELSHLSVVVFALVSVVGFLAYAFQGIGKFAEVFFPWDLAPETYALIFMSITTVYVILGGMYSVVLTDLIQFIVLTAASVYVGIIAIGKVTPEAIAEKVPEGWHNIFFGGRLDLDWSGLLASVNDTIGSDGYTLFGIFFMMMLFKGVLSSMAGPAPNYDMQRVLATRTPKEAAYMSGFVSVVLYLPRYLLIAGITVLGVVYFSDGLKEMGADVDFEQILPYVIQNYIPVGLVGLLLAGLLAAFMSTFDSTVNSGAAYLVNDLYKRYIDPRASQRKYVLMSYGCSVAVVIVGIGFGFMTDSINQVLQWMVAGLFGGYIAPNVLKWHWWRLNGYGYFAGMIAGIVMAMAIPKAVPGLWPEWYANFNETSSHFPLMLAMFPVILAVSGLVSIVVSWVTPASEEAVLKSFYKQVRPWGFWGPIRAKVLAEDSAFEPNKGFRRDMVNVAVGIVWHTMLAAVPIYLVIREMTALAICAVVLAVTTVFLKFNWLDRLPDD